MPVLLKERYADSWRLRGEAEICFILYYTSENPGFPDKSDWGLP